MSSHIQNWRAFLESQYQWEQRRKYHGKITAQDPEPDYNPELKRMFDEEVARLRREQLERVKAENAVIETKLQQLQQALAAHQARREAEALQKLEGSKKPADGHKARGAEGPVYVLYSGGQRSDAPAGSAGYSAAETVGAGEGDRKTSSAVSSKSALLTPWTGAGSTNSMSVAAGKDGSQAAPKFYDVSTPFFAKSQNGEPGDADDGSEQIGSGSNRGRIQMLLRSREREEQARRLAAQHCRTLLAEVGASALPVDRLPVLPRNPDDPPFSASHSYTAASAAFGAGASSPGPLSAAALTSSHASQQKRRGSPPQTHKHMDYVSSPSLAHLRDVTGMHNTLDLPVASIYMPKPSPRSTPASHEFDGKRKTYVSSSRALGHAASKSGFADAFTDVFLSNHPPKSTRGPNLLSNVFSFQAKTPNSNSQSSASSSGSTASLSIAALSPTPQQQTSLGSPVLLSPGSHQ